jgi:hydroxymethylpyrimidine/phosphomethylpyrimidine kinase
MSIAGSDNSAGAGIQADLKTFAALGVYGLTAVTCVVAEAPGTVESVQPMAPDLVARQIRLGLDHFPVAAIKTGMLYSAAIIRSVLDSLKSIALPLVVDPVMVATSGDSLLLPDATALYRDALIPAATLVTPNLDEAAALLGRPIATPEEMRVAGAELTGRFGVPFLVKGGHLRGDRALDLLFHGGSVFEFESPFRHGVSTHGTGCTFSAAITAGLAKGLALPEAVAAGKQFVADAIGHAFRWVSPRGPVDALNHLRPGGSSPSFEDPARP